ncbi:MAG: hypothetical protein HYV63_02640 [Candidatus Schekmanbacteria bacterium]|nr:hypothetical protein [Candidatus Schekmanbacteria bacterium]
MSTWRKVLLSLVGQGDLPFDPRYVNRSASHLAIETSEPCCTIDGEVFPTVERRIEVRLGPQLQIATLAARRRRLKPAPQDAESEPPAGSVTVNR